MNYTKCCHHGVMLISNSVVTDVNILGTYNPYKHDPSKVCYIQRELSSRVDSIATTTSCPKQSSVYIATEVPCNIEVIKRNYVVKNNIDDADYVVYHKPRKEYITSNMLHYYHPDKNIFILTGGMCDVACIRRDFDIKSKAINIYGITFDIYNDKKNQLTNLVTGKIKKPIIKFENLDLSFGDDLTYDILSLTRRLGSISAHNNSSVVEDYITNLKSICNYNWMDYKGTLNMLFNMNTLKNFNTAHSIVRNRSRSYGKTISNLFDNCLLFTGFSSEKDLELTKEIITKEFNLENFPMFVTYSSLQKKLITSGIPLNIFESAFSTITKITPKKYVSTQYKNQVQ